MRIAIIDGHPDPDRQRYGHVLADAYAEGARSGGHEVEVIRVGEADFPLIRGVDEWKSGQAPAAISEAQQTIEWAEHLVIIHPLWLGMMPALLKGFLEQTLRPGFAVAREKSGMTWKKRLGGRSARVVITMGMPALAYRWYFRAHSLKTLKRNILRFCGIGPIRTSLIGMVEAGDSSRREQWLERMRALGARGR